MSIQQVRSQQAPSDAVAAAEAIMQRLERAWNSADGTGYSEPFSPDADFVTIRGDLHAGRDAIAAGHEEIFGTIYAGSTIRYQVLRARELDDRTIIAHARSSLTAPALPLAGASTLTLVLLKQDDGWQITALHNTLVAQ